MVRAHDAVGASQSRQQFVGPVLAHVVERPQLAVAAPHQGDGHARHLQRQIRARLPQRLDVAHPLPGAAEDLALLDLEPAGLNVGVGVQGHRTGRVGVVTLGDSGRGRAVAVGGCRALGCSGLDARHMPQSRRRSLACGPSGPPDTRPRLEESCDARRSTSLDSGTGSHRALAPMACSGDDTSATPADIAPSSEMAGMASENGSHHDHGSSVEVAEGVPVPTIADRGHGGPGGGMEPPRPHHRLQDRARERLHRPHRRGGPHAPLRRR